MNVKSKIPKTVKLKTYLVTIFLVCVICAGALSYTLGQSYIGSVSEVWVQPPFNEATYVFGKYNTTFYYARSSLTGNYEWLSINDDTVLQNSVDATNVDGGGSVYVKAGTYSLTVTMKDNVQLILENGATGITVSIGAGATCWIQDYNAARTRYYSSGVLKWDENHATGTISTLIWNNIWNQTVLWVVENYTSLLWRGDWNTTVQNIMDLYSLAWKNGWNVTVEDVIDNFDSLSWKGLWNTTVEAIITAYDLGWNDNWNTTVQDIIDNYDIDWNANWNSTVEDIIANYVWQNSLDMNQQQIVNMTFWSGTNFPANPAEGQPFWRTDEDTFYVYNGTGWESMATGATGPAGPAGQVEGLPFTYLVFENSTSRYLVNGTTGAIDWSSTNSANVINAAVGNLTHTRKQRIVVKGYHTITSPIQVENYTVLDLYGAQLTLGINVNMIETANDDNVHSVEIHGGVLWGFGYIGDAIHFNVTQDLMPSWRNIISDITIKYFVGDGLSLYGSGGRSLVSNLYIYDCTRGVYANSPDGKFINVIVGDSGKQAWYVSGSSNMISNCKGYGSGYDDVNQGSGIIFYGRNIHVFGSIFQENHKYGAEITSSATAISMTGCVFDRNSLNAANTYDGVYIAGTNVSITGGECKNLYGKSYTQRYGIYIASTADNVKLFGIVGANLLNDLYYTDPAATNILIDEEIGDGGGESVSNRAWSYMCWKNATSVYVTSGSSGEIVHTESLTTAEEAFEWAFGQCSGTVQEKVVIKGSYSDLDQIDLDTAHVTVEILGYLHLAVGQSALFNISTTADFAEFCGGGTIDPNGDSQSSTTHGMLFTSVDDCSVHHLYFRSGYGHSGMGDTIRFAECKRCSVHDCEFRPYQDSYDSVKIRGTGSHDNIVANNRFYIDDSCYSCAIQVSNGAYRNLVIGNIIYVNDVLGDHASGIKLHDADYNLITDNHIYITGNPWGGIDIIEDGDFNQIIDNWIQGADHGIWVREVSVEAPTWNAIKDNYIILRDADGANGIELEDTDNTVVQGNTIICSGTTGTQDGVFVESGCTDTLVKDNNFDVNLDENVDNDAGTETSEVGSVEISFP